MGFSASQTIGAAANAAETAALAVFEVEAAVIGVHQTCRSSAQKARCFQISVRRDRYLQTCSRTYLLDFATHLRSQS